MKGTLTVWWDQRIVGTLRLDDHGDMSFVYDDKWLADAQHPALSISLPKQAAPFNRRRTRPFFAGLLPEEAPRAAAARAVGVSKENDFALLKALGGEVAGALTLWPEGQPPPAEAPPFASQPLGDNALVELLDTLPERPFLAGREGLRLSLAGAQTKLPVVLIDDRIALPAPGQPTTHILKPPIKHLPATTENEAFAMRLAAASGLDVAPVEARQVADRPFLLVTRYDRVIDKTGRAHRLHQEDFCQALAIPPEHKYAAEHGPTFKTGFDLVRRAVARPAIDVLKLLDAAIFNLIVGNADAHGKNFSLLHRADGITLAPLYDVMCTVAYPDVAARLAMKMGGASILDDVDSATWTKFAIDTGLGAPHIRRRVAELATVIAASSEAVAASLSAGGFNAVELKRFAAIARERSQYAADSLERRTR